MSSDQIDELANFRARRNRDRQPPETDATSETPWSAEQADALARARESWALSQLGREGSRSESGEAEPCDATEE